MNRRTRLSLFSISFLVFLSPVPATESPSYPGYVIQRDAYGVPHIYSATVEGLFRGMGYAVAEDRLWQLELLSRTGLGALAEILGPVYRTLDQHVHTWGYTAAEVDSQYQALDPETRTVVEAYAAGINDRIADVMSNPDALLPFEFWGTSSEPSTWTPARTMAVISYLTRSFGSTGGLEMDRLEELEAMGPEAFDAAYPVNDPSAPTTIAAADDPGPPPGVLVMPGRDRDARLSRLRQARERWHGRVSPAGRTAFDSIRAVSARACEELGLPPTFGSFAVVVDSTKSASRWSLLLGGPQTGTPHADAVQLGVEVDLQGAGFHVSGMSIAGLPAIVIGRNRDLAWTLTSGITDNVDIYIETLNPSNPEQYLWNGTWQTFVSRTDTILVNGHPEPYLVRRSIHGPVDAIDRTAGQAFSRRVTYRGREAHFLVCLLDMNRAASLDTIEAALPSCTLSFNVFASTLAGGRVGFWHAGLYQDRLDGVDPRLPHDGTGSEEWHGFLAFESQPKRLDPSTHFFANWNNKPVSWWNNGDNVAWVGWQHVRYITDYVGPDPSVTLADLKTVPIQIQSKGTYEQVIEVSTPALAYNILPPGQSGFVNRYGVRSPHFADQWALYQAWNFKTWTFDPVRTDVATVLPASRVAALVSIGPRPAGHAVDIELRLAAEADLEVDIYDAAGRMVRSLGAGHLPAGSQSFTWDTRDAEGHEVPPGVYFARVIAPAGVSSAKIVLAPEM